MYVCIYINTCIYIYTHVYIYMYTHVYKVVLHIYIIYTCVYIQYMCIYKCICVYKFQIRYWNPKSRDFYFHGVTPGVNNEKLFFFATDVGSK